MGRYSEGFEAFDRRLARIPQRAKDAIHGVLEQNADELVAAQRTLVDVESGTLRDSIRKQDGRNELQVVVRAGGPTTTKPVREGVKATYDYALGTEYGTQHESPHPFFWPAYRLLRKRFKNRAARAARKAALQESGGD